MYNFKHCDKCYKIIFDNEKYTFKVIDSIWYDTPLEIKLFNNKWIFNNLCLAKQHKEKLNNLINIIKNEENT